MMAGGTRTFLIDKEHYTQSNEYSDCQAERNHNLDEFPTSVPFAKRNIGQKREAQ